MTEQHLITPPPELFKQWEGMPRSVAFEAAYRAGADHELEACCEWVDTEFPTYVKCDGPASFRLANARRPKPPSLAEEALEQLSLIETAFNIAYGGDLVDTPIRRALERLQELEGGNG